MSSQEAEAEDPPIIFERGTKTAVFFVLDNHAVLRRETKTNYSVLTSISISAKVRRSDRREQSYTVGSRDFN